MTVFEIIPAASFVAPQAWGSAYIRHVVRKCGCDRPPSHCSARLVALALDEEDSANRMLGRAGLIALPVVAGRDNHDAFRAGAQLDAVFAADLIKCGDGLLKVAVTLFEQRSP